MNSQLEDLKLKIKTSDAARIIGISESHVRKLLQEGKLNAIPTVLGHLFDEDEVHDFARKRGVRNGLPIHPSKGRADGYCSVHGAALAGDCVECKAIPIKQDVYCPIHGRNLVADCLTCQG